MPDPALHSASQIARVSTESWTLQNFYCPACSKDLASFPQGTKVYDFYSPDCSEKFQLKSAAHAISRSILGSEFKTTLESILANQQPSLFLLRYDQARWTVEDFNIIHRACITTSCIIPRKPLSMTARRAGWQGCLISLDRIPELGKIEVINQGVPREKGSVLEQWRQSATLLGTRPEFRGWLADVLTCVEKSLTNFTLDDMYSFEEELAAKHLENHNIRPKIRQQLQVLRDLGLVKFVSPGVYQYLGKSSQKTSS